MDFYEFTLYMIFPIFSKIAIAIREPRTAWSEDRPVRLGPKFSKFCCSWSGSVRDFPKTLISTGPGPSWSKISYKFWSRSELVLFGPGPSWSYLFKIYSILYTRSWFKSVGPSIFFGPGPVRDRSVSVRGSLIAILLIKH